jgi:DnaJ domain
VFIVWRQRPVKGKGGGPFLIRDADFLEHLTCWMPLRCEHRGDGRVAHTPLVMTSSRTVFAADAQPRQKLLVRFPTIRSCCIADRFARAAWWYRVNLVISSWDEGDRNAPLVKDFSRDGPDMLRKLRSVVPRPSARGEDEFTTYRLGKEAEHEIKKKAERDWWWSHGPGRDQREAETRARQQAEEDRRRQEDRIRDLLRGLDDPTCFAVLGLGPDATIDQVKGRYRDLAKRHHPDRGGDAAEFRRIVAAYDEACDLLAGRSPA